jgi:hypothetical protein
MFKYLRNFKYLNLKKFFIFVFVFKKVLDLFKKVFDTFVFNIKKFLVKILLQLIFNFKKFYKIF